MYEKRPIRWGDLPRHREDVFLPVYKPRDSSGIVHRIEAGFGSCRRRGTKSEDRCFAILTQCFSQQAQRRRRTSADSPYRAEALADPANHTRQLLNYNPDYLRYTYDDVIDCLHPVPELEALMRQCMILHNQYPWDPSASTHGSRQA